MQKMEREIEQFEKGEHPPLKLERDKSIESVPMQPQKGKASPLVNKNMSIRDQIRAQDNKKGKKHYLIDSEDSVDWFLRTIVAPEHSKKGYLQFQREKEAMIAAGEIPRDITQQLEFFSKNARMASEKVDDEMSIDPKGVMAEGEESIIDVKDLEPHMVDRDHFRFDSKTQALLDRLDADNFKKSIRSTLSQEEKLLLDMEAQERDSLSQLLDEMKSEGIPLDLIP